MIYHIHITNYFVLTEFLAAKELIVYDCYKGSTLTYNLDQLPIGTFYIKAQKGVSLISRTLPKCTEIFNKQLTMHPSIFFLINKFVPLNSGLSYIIVYIFYFFLHKDPHLALFDRPLLDHNALCFCARNLRGRLLLLLAIQCVDHKLHARFVDAEGAHEVGMLEEDLVVSDIPG